MLDLTLTAFDWGKKKKKKKLLTVPETWLFALALVGFKAAAVKMFAV